MKILTLTAFLIMSLTMVSCGGDKEKSSSNRGFSTNKLSTQSGYLNLQTNDLELGGRVYPQNPAYAAAINQGLAQARMKNPPVQPVIHNGVQKYRVKVTAQVIDYNQGGYQPYPPQQMNQGTLNISHVVVY